MNDRVRNIRNEARKKGFSGFFCRIEKRYPVSLDQKELMLSWDREKFEKLLEVKNGIDDDIFNFVAQEDDIIVISRVIKMLNRNINFSPELVKYARIMDDTDQLNKVYDYFHREDAYKIFEGMSIQQIKEVVKARESGISLDKIKNFMLDLEASKMIQMRKALKSSFAEDKVKLSYLYELSTLMSADELREIRKLMEFSYWTVNKINMIVSKNFNKDQLSCIRKAYENEISMPKLMYLINSEFDTAKMRRVADAFDAGVTLEEVKGCVACDNKTFYDMIEAAENRRM